MAEVVCVLLALPFSVYCLAKRIFHVSNYDLTAASAAHERSFYRLYGLCQHRATLLPSRMVPYAGSEYLNQFLKSLSQATRRSDATITCVDLTRIALCT